MSTPGPNYPSGNFTENPLLNQLLSLLDANQFAPPGMVFGQFSPNQNLLDTLDAREFARAQSGAAMGLGHDQAQQSLSEILVGRDGTVDDKGGLVGLGVLSADRGAEALKQVDQFSRDIGAVMPFLASVAPGAMLDSVGFGGWQQGSNLASLLRPAMGGHGREGLAPTELRDTAVQLGEDLNRNLFDDGTLEKTAGFDRGQSSQVLVAGANMGIAPSGQQLAGMSREDRSAAATDATISLTQGAAAIRDLGGSFAAMDSNSMLQTLDQLSMGKLSKGKDAAELGMHVRQLNELSQSANVSIGEIAGLQQYGGAIAERLGGSKSTGLVAGKHAAAFGSFLNSKEGEGVVAAAGVSKNELMQQDALLTAQASRSENANTAAALMSMGESGMLKGRAKEMYEKLRDKGEMQSMTPQQLMRVLKSSGVDQGAASVILRQRGANLEKYGEKVSGAVRKQQFDADVGSYMQRHIANQIGIMGGKRMSSQRALQLGGAVTSTLRDMPGKSREEMQEALIKKFKEMGIKGKQADSLAIAALGSADEAAIRKGYKNVSHVAALHSSQAMKGIDEAQKKAEITGAARASNAHIGQKDAIARTVDAVKDGNRDDPVTKFLAKTLGAVDAPTTGASGTPGSATRAAAAGTPGTAESAAGGASDMDASAPAAAAPAAAATTAGDTGAASNDAVSTGTPTAALEDSAATGNASAAVADAAVAADTAAANGGGVAVAANAQRTGSTGQSGLGDGAATTGPVDVRIVSMPSVKLAGSDDVPGNDIAGPAAAAQPMDAGAGVA